LLEAGDVDNGLLSVGQVIGLVHDVPTVSELIDRVIKEADEIIASMTAGGTFRPLRKPSDVPKQ